MCARCDALNHPTSHFYPGRIANRVGNCSDWQPALTHFPPARLPSCLLHVLVFPFFPLAGRLLSPAGAGWQREPHLKTLVLSLGLVAVLLCESTIAKCTGTGPVRGGMIEPADECTNMNLFYGVFFGLYAVYLIECFCVSAAFFPSFFGEGLDFGPDVYLFLVSRVGMGREGGVCWTPYALLCLL